MPESLTQRWLRQNISAYSHRDIVYTHVDAVLVAHPTLRPKTDVYTYDDGRSQLMLCVHGLLPIVFRGTSYNIPIAIWLTHQYPSEPPIVYVIPTSDMLVKASKYVQVSGLCIPPYIENWRKKSEASSLTALAQVLIEQFSREPPVYAKPSTALTSDYSRPPPVPQRPSPSATSSRPPTPPPRPPPLAGSSSPGSSPHYARSQMYPSQPRPSEPPRYVSPPISQYPHQRSTSATHHSSPPAHIPPYTPSPSHQWGSPLQQSPGPFNPPHLVTRPPSSVSPAPPPPPRAPTHVPPPAPPLSTPAPNLLDEDIDLSTIPTPAMEAPPPPPRPPNPEIVQLHSRVLAKFSAELANFQGSLAADMQRLQTAQTDLLAGDPAIRDEMARLEAVRDVCAVVRDRYKITVESAEANVSELKKKGDPEVDELICSTTIVYNQLIDLIAEDNAIEDTIYHLHRALNAGRIDLDKFLRITRSLAEEQFMKRALAEKIASSIPMGVWH